jgi:hypothetical protein
LWATVKYNVYVSPLPIRVACANTGQEILHNVWQEVEYRFDVAQSLVVLTVNFINDKLL